MGLPAAGISGGDTLAHTFRAHYPWLVSAAVMLVASLLGLGSGFPMLKFWLTVTVLTSVAAPVLHLVHRAREARRDERLLASSAAAMHLEQEGALAEAL